MRKKFVIIAVCIMAQLASSSVASAADFDIEESYKSVFVVYSGDSLGSGFAFGENLIISNAHVVGGKNDVKIRSYDGTFFDATILAKDDGLDLVAFVIADGKFPLLKAGYDYAVGDDVFAIGAPHSMAYTVTKGIVSSKDRNRGGQNYIQTDAPINAGNSGGPLLDHKGFVIGINTMKMKGTEGIGLAIPIIELVEFLKQHEVPLEQSGNVSGEVRIAEQNLPPSPINDSSTGNSAVWIVMLGISVVLNTVLIVLLFKAKKPKPKFDKSDRTDFDIDMIE